MALTRNYLKATALVCASVSSGGAVAAAGVFDDSVTVNGNNTFLLLNSSVRDWTLRSDGDLTLSRSGAVSIVPFTLASSAPNNAMFMSAAGNLGLGTSTPGGTLSARIHIADPTPDILLDDTDNSQLWYLFADYEGMGFGDGSSSTIPFYVETGAPLDSLVVKSNGFVGVGTFEPDGNFHVKVDDNAFLLPFVVENTNAINFSGFRLQISPTSFIDFNNSGGNFRINADQIPGSEFEVQPSGNSTVKGTMTAKNFVSSSDRNAKQDIEAIDHQALLAKVMEIPVSEWSYRTSPDSRHIGPMAQDFYKAFGLGDTDKGITSIDAGGVALAAIQGVKREKDREFAQLIAEKNAEIDLLRTEIEQLKLAQDERILQLEMAVSSLMSSREGDRVVAR